MQKDSWKIKISDHWNFSKFLPKSHFPGESLKNSTPRPFNSQGKAKTPPYRADETTYGFTGAVRIRPDLVHLWYGEVDLYKM